MLSRTNASLRQPTLYARRKPPERSVVVPLEKARSSSLSWEARAKAQRIVTSSFSVRVGATVPPKSGCVRYWKACGRASQLRCMSLKYASATQEPSARVCQQLREKSPAHCRIPAGFVSARHCSGGVRRQCGPASVDELKKE